MSELRWSYICLMLALGICAALVIFVVEREADRVITALQSEIQTLQEDVDALERKQGSLIKNQDKCQWMEKAVK